MMGTAALLTERIRRQTMDDDRYYRRWLMFFELEVPAELAWWGGNRFLFPLVIPPESYELSEPYTVDATPTTGAGLIVEEDGIVQRTIRLEGHTGFKPRALRGSLGPLLLKGPEAKSHARSLMVVPRSPLGLSGHGHFMYLQDVIFRTYADLKRDPATSKGTKLYFHVPKDMEHWRVVPRQFTLRRTAADRTLYRYSIDLLVTGPAEAVSDLFSEEVGLLGKIKNAIRAVQAAIDLVSGAVRDLTAMIDEVRRFVKDALKIIDAVTGIMNAGRDFLDGTKALIEVPLAAVSSVVELVESAMAVVERAQRLGQINLPAQVSQKWRQIADGMDLLAAHPDLFVRPDRVRLRSADAQSRRVAGQTGTTVSSFDDVRALGTAPTVGDVQSAQGSLATPRAPSAATGARAVVVNQGDSLTALASRYLGDARRWREIATLNGIRPPYLPDGPLPPVGVGSASTMRVGDQILIPTFGPPPSTQPTVPILGARASDAPDAQTLGRDLKLVVVGGRPGADLFDVAINTDTGRVEPQTVEGWPCLAQGLRMRLATERGSDLLYRGLGMERTIGFGDAEIDAETVRFRIAQTITQDPRVLALRRLSATPTADDVAIEVDVEIRGLGERRTIQVTE